MIRVGWKYVPPRGERSCICGVRDTLDGPENIYEKYVRAEWADTEIERLRDALK